MLLFCKRDHQAASHIHAVLPLGRPVEGHVRGERPHRAPKTASPVVRPRRAAASPSAVKLVVEQNPPLSWRLLALVS